VAWRRPHQPRLDVVAPLLEIGDLLQRHRPASHPLRQQGQHELELVVRLSDAVPGSQLLGGLVQPQLLVKHQALETYRHGPEPAGAGRRPPFPPLGDAGVEQDALDDDREVGAQLAFTPELPQRGAAALDQLQIDVRRQLLRFLDGQAAAATHDGDCRVDGPQVGGDGATPVPGRHPGLSGTVGRLLDLRKAFKRARGRLHVRTTLDIRGTADSVRPLMDIATGPVEVGHRLFGAGRREVSSIAAGSNCPHHEKSPGA